MKLFYFFAIPISFLISCQGQPVNLSLNLKKGENYTQTMTSSGTITQTMNGQNIDYGVSISGKLNYLISDTLATDYEIEVKYTSLAMDMKLPQGARQFSSETKDSSDIFSNLLSGLKNRPFYIRMTNKGEVKEVRGIDSLLFNMFAKFPNLSEAQKTQIKDQFTKAYGENAFKGNIKMVTAIFPDHPVSVGDKWTINTQLQLAMEANLKSTYEYKGESNGNYLIHGESKIETANKDAYIETNGISLKYNLTGTMTSEIKINKESGWIVDAQIEQLTAGGVEIKANPKMPSGMKVPMSMKSHTRITNE